MIEKPLLLSHALERKSTKAKKKEDDEDADTVRKKCKPFVHILFLSVLKLCLFPGC